MLRDDVSTRPGQAEHIETLPPATAHRDASPEYPRSGWVQADALQASREHVETARVATAQAQPYRDYAAPILPRYSTRIHPSGAQNEAASASPAHHARIPHRGNWDNTTSA